MVTERQAVDEMFGNPVYEVEVSDAEKLEFAAMRIRDLEQQVKLNGLLINSLKMQLETRNKRIETILHCCADIARQISLHGSDDHKTKNEAILRVVARLLTLEFQYSDTRLTPEPDEIPF